VNLELLKRVELFLYHEARLMDEQRYDEWLSLWTDELTYFVPVNDEDVDPKRHVTLIYDDRRRLEDRIEQLKSHVHWSQEPRSRIRRVVSNVEVTDGPEVKAESNFVLVEVRRDQQMVLAGRSFHTLVPDPSRASGQAGSFRISEKKVLLVNLDAVMRNIRFLL
jgi:3-phenylpropionate/cinnamic acid dioxygenase small subunit